MLRALCILALLFALPAGGAECWPGWRDRGFSAEGPVGRNTLFRIGGAEPYASFYDRLDRGHCEKEWLVVVYMAADNSLSPYSFRDLWEMEAAGSYPSVDVVVFHDHASSDGIRYYHVAHNPRQADYRPRIPEFARKHGLEEAEPRQQEEAFLAAEGPGLIASPAVVDLPEGDSADRRQFEGFLDWALTHYPARRVMLVGWSHGYGLASNALVSEKGAFALEEGRTKNAMPVSVMTEALREVLARHRQGRPLDIAGSDACLNQQVEFGYEWRGLADYLFGSSTIVQNKGFNYRTLLKWFGEHPAFSTADLAAKIPALYGGSVTEGAGRKYSSYYDPYATMATWTVSELGALRVALDRLAGELLDYVNEPASDIDRLSRKVDLRNQVRQSLRLGGASYDLFNLLQAWESWARTSYDLAAPRQRGRWEAVRAAINVARDALQRSVLSAHVGKKYRQGLVLTSKGVAIWLPQSAEEYRKLAPVFQHSAFYQGSAWGELVRALYER